MKAFESINKGFSSAFKAGELTIGVVVPIEQYTAGPVPTMQKHLKRAQLVDELGFKALWVRDVPFNVPSFGDAGQTYDPFTYLGFLAGHTKSIALGVGSIALPLHHPVHIAKSAATIDQLSEGRLLLGIASGDRPNEYPGMGFDFEKRGESFREAFTYIRKAAEDFPIFNTQQYGELTGQVDILPKPTAHKIPLIVTGHSQQSLEWNATHGDGWFYYPRDLYQQQYRIAQWREWMAKTHDHDKPFLQPLYVDLQENDDFLPQPIHLGMRIGANHLIEYFNHLKSIGVNHVAINLRFNTAKIEHTLEKLADKVLPYFHSNTIEKITS